MADRTGKGERASVNLSPAVRDLLNDQIARLEAEQGRVAKQEQLIGALLLGVPTWQAALMLDSYIRQTASRGSTDAGQTGDM
jgi:hypothetical protein